MVHEPSLSSVRLRVVLQRVRDARIWADSQFQGSFKHGLLLLLGVGGQELRSSDSEEQTWRETVDLQTERLVEKVLRLRTFADDAGKMNLSLLETGGSLGLVSQFTLHASLRKGNRPSFQGSAPPALAKEVYESVRRSFMTELGQDRVVSGVFGAHMELEFINDGPVTYVFEVSQSSILDWS